MKKLSGIKTVICDIDDTLYPSTEFASIARKNAIQSMLEAGLDAGAGRAYAALSAIVAKYSSNYPHHLDRLCEKFGCLGDKKIIAAGIKGYHDTKLTIQPFPDVPRTLLELRLRGYKLCVASEGFAIKQWEKLIRLRLHHFFGQVFVSEELGMSKSKKFYVHIAGKLGNAGNCLMAGDRLEKDIIPAKAAGMRTALLLASQNGRDIELNKPSSKYIDLRLRTFSDLLKYL
ncbi:haloacid dehalogenase [Candidatus Micrarchaeota archaeon CG08_land_8_20_14_0_20_49_17]|nr:MAG: haloacid dehalogenase [Candidatus Micrarchaeota archaeon CG08_land_8_20_14_0_20_49_17]PIZ96698.1 MAG: haloacid dehalogenase [Candidatus Micrarchaeota archaeon CG_4_10_14_0_2_um_filter_49_7]HII53237.1 HAD-IA family hydrolase [Candidatus Micrarchaeota archaeon]